MGRARSRGTSRPTGAVLTLVLAVIAGAIVSGGGSQAAAETADEAEQRAHQAAEAVSALQGEVDAARERYEVALQEVAGSISVATTSEQQADEAALVEQRAASERTAALRALTQSGGTLGMVDTVLSAKSPGELVAQWQLGEQVMAVLSHRSQESSAVADRSQSRFVRADARAEQAVATASDVTAAYAELQDVLNRQQLILDRLDSRARRLAEAEQAAAELAAERAAAAAAAGSSAATATAGGIPKDFLALYQSAALTCPGLPWPVLAAVGQVESGHGSNNGPSSAGAEGPMQFLPSTFAGYAVDGDGDGVSDIWNPPDAIYSAASYLCANGAGNGPRGLYTALWHYNHADWYVLMVVAIAGQIADRFGEPIPVAQAS